LTINESGAQAALRGEREMGAALRDLSDAFDAECAAFEVFDRTARAALLFEQARVSPEAIKDYAEHYHAISPRVAYGLRPDARPILHDAHILTEEDMARDPFYAEFLARQGLRYFLSMSLDPEPGILAVVSLQFRSGRGPVEKTDVTVATALRPLLARSMRDYWRARNAQCSDWVRDDLIRAFRLTRAEARLAAALHAGIRLNDHAEQTGISLNTAYTHYARMKQKLGCRRQAEVLARLHRLHPRGPQAVASDDRAP
jgi:DNA-binding CsgD family transcriptional regulator